MRNLRLRHAVLAIALPAVTTVGLLLGMPAPAAGFEHPPLKGFLKEKFKLSAPPVPAPQAGFTDGSGRSVSLGAFRGQVVLLNFWATWCPPCVWEMPTLNSLQARLRGEGLAVVTVSVDRGGYPVVKPFFKRHGLVHLKAYLDPMHNLRRHFGYGGLPTTVLIDAKGCVVGMMEGAAKWDSPDTIELVRYYLRRAHAAPERLDLEAKRQDVPLTYAEAMEWYRKAANQGDVNAQYVMGFYYARGECVPHDYVQAHMWWNLSAAQGHKNAAKHRDTVAKRMTPDQIAEAQHLASEWLETHGKVE